MKIVVDMNLSPDWCAVLADAGHDAVHWSALGDPRAADAEIMAWARREGRVVLTHDLDFSAILATTGAGRTQCRAGLFPRPHRPPGHRRVRPVLRRTRAGSDRQS